MAEGTLPVRDPPLREEPVHQSPRARITRVYLPGGTVIRKEPQGADAERRLRHELAILARLRGLDGVAQLLEAPRLPGSIVLADAGHTNIAVLPKPFAVDELVRLALALARVVASMHARGVMHRDISPANIVLSGDGAPCLVDFALATWLSEIRPEFTHQAAIAGTLPYLAPEQTGRTGRSVDQRADLYALGATLYEMATGKPPFGSGDPLRLTHDHLALVPAAPSDINPAVPRCMSEIVMHLLEKDPDNRYQTADGAVYDLERLRDPAAHAGMVAWQVGEHDVPARLLPPSRLVGRDAEVAALKGAFEEALAGRCRGVLVTGPAGVGKTALVDELRQVVTDRDGWFVTGKFDPYRRDLEFDAVYQGLRALGRLLLAEPEDELAKVRRRILAALGPNAGQTYAVMPEFAALLGVAPAPGEPLTAEARAQRSAAEILRAVASPQRSLVFFVDDLQWAGRTPLGFVDLVLSQEQIDGLLLVGAYRNDVDATHPLSALLARWEEETEVAVVRLENLPVPDLVAMVSEMLRVDASAAAGLVDAIEPHVRGNPYEMVELLAALSRDGVLSATAAGWQWDNETARSRLGNPVVPALVTARLDAIPPASRHLVEAMACLGGRAELSVLQVAAGEPAEVVEEKLAPVLESGALVTEPGTRPAVRFRHDRIREVVLRDLEPFKQRSLQLAMARRLAGVPELFAVAAEQYLPVVDAVDEAAERHQAEALLRRAAEQASLIGDYATVDTLLTGALHLVDSRATDTLIELHTGRQTAVYSLGRVEEAEEEYRTIDGLGANAIERAEATAVQVRSLTHRNRFAEATTLGIELLRELAISVPPANTIAAELHNHFGYLYRWLDETGPDDDLVRADITDPTLLAATRLINAMLPAAYLGADHALLAWLGLEAVRIWLEHGPGRTLLGPASHAAFEAVALRGDCAGGSRAFERILKLGEARGYEPETSQARFQLSFTSPWFESIEKSVREGQRAADGLLAGGDLANAGYCRYTVVATLFDCAPTLDAFAAEVEAGASLVRRTGNAPMSQQYDSYRWLARVLREGSAPGSEPLPIEGYSDSPLFSAHITRAIAAAILGDPVELVRRTAPIPQLLPAVVGSYPSAVARTFRGLALAGEARATDGDEQLGALSELDERMAWLAARAADAPDNFLHLQRLLEAERAWAVGDFRAAVLAFDEARREAAQRQRPWHRALIAERAARFYLAYGVDRTGYDLLAEARREYSAWGASAKVDQLDWAYPTLRPVPDVTDHADAARAVDLSAPRSSVTSGTIDLLGILSASQALSSETSIERLNVRVNHVLGEMTGATSARLLVWSDAGEKWMVPAPDRDGASLRTVANETAVPLSIVRYVRRTGEALVVADASRDARFARDPYFARVELCSVLALPIANRGAQPAVLLLENRLIRGAFTAERLDVVELIAGQLAVSLENARVYSEFRRVADEQAALRRVATIVARGEAPGSLFAAVAEEVGQLVPEASTTLVARYHQDRSIELVGAWSKRGSHGLVGERVKLGGRNVSSLVFDRNEPLRVDSIPDETAPATQLARDWARSAAGAPIHVDGQLWGVIIIGAPAPNELPTGIEFRLANFTELVATAIANAESRAELTSSRARIVAAADEARRRIERDVHDGAQQRLVSLGLQLRAAQASVPPELGDLRARLDRAVADLGDAVEELREIARGIHPTILVRRGLRLAVKALARRVPIGVDLEIGDIGRLGEAVEITAYYVFAEALTNVVKHAHASAVVATAELNASGTVLRIEVRDDGAGGADFTAGTGLVGLRDRVEALGGRVSLDSRPGAGTALRVELPVTPIAVSSR
jgi:predicted ATPase/signal transduction histidine kinase